MVLQLIRKLSIVVIKMFLTRYAVMQAVLTTCVLCVDLLLSAKYTPYNVKSLNILEVICTMSAIVVMNCGLLIHTRQYRSDTDRTAMGVVILILIFTCISITIGIFLIEVKTKIQKQLMQGSISKQSLDESVWASKQIGGDAAPAKLQKTSYLRDAFANIGSRSNSGILHPPLSGSPAAVSRAPSTKKYLEVAPNSNGSGMLQRI
ncbi:hypothetical protein BKA69DRAFT_929953 [Paraphysoderma sedebokerense]|nr:hypothetical protein BKA69DRAFT_929953 [Paraphysoderma sedebokerense]